MRKDDTIQFLALLQAENRIQIPIEIRQHRKLESGRFLRIKIEFIARLSSDGRITVPWEIRWKLETKPGQMMRIFLHPED